MTFPRPKFNRHYLLLTFVSLTSSLLLWLPFYLRLPSIWGIPLPQDGMATIVANFDGPYYIVTAKSLYQPDTISSRFEFPLPAIYYSAHWPAYPLTIRFLATLLPFLSYPYTMLLSTQIASVLAVIFFYKLLQKLDLSSAAFPLSIAFLLFPARFLIVRSIGSPEPLFIFALLASLYYFLNRKIWLAAGFGALAQLTKSPGLLLLLAYASTLLYQSWPHLAIGDIKNFLRSLKITHHLPLLLIPLTTLGVFLWYNHTYHDFFAYFHSGDNIHLLFPPFQIFNSSFPWVGTFWLEEIIYIYLIEALAVFTLLKNEKFRPLGIFALLFFISTLFISHRDLARYSLPLAPFVLIAGSSLVPKREFQIAFAIILIPIYLYTLNFISQNAAPISDWTPLL